MPQPTHQDSNPGAYDVNKTQTIFLATRQELLKRIDNYSSGSRKSTGRYNGFSGNQRPTWHTPQ